MRRLEFEAEPKIPMHRSYKKQCSIQTRAHPFTIEAQMAHFVCQERYGTLISKRGKETVRVGRFLKPCAKSSADAEGISTRGHILFEEMSSREKGWPNKVNFLGWACPQRNWEKWVEKLKVKHSIMWKQIGIYNAIMSSCCEIRRNKEIVLGLVEFWCSEMNTFVFPWGEATITLEDVMILGGFSVIGEPIKKGVITGDLKMMVEAMSEKKTAMARGRSKKATHGAWMNHFMENANDSEAEHVAFLSLWLSRYVFPLRNNETISKDAFPIAAHLAGGTQMALAPVILAGLYKNLSLLKEKALAFSSDEIELTVFAPFQLVLLWAFEHLPQLVGKPPNVLKPEEPRAARWSKVICKMDKSVVDTIFLSGQCFQWRPYAADISNWNHSSYYKVEERLEVDSEKNFDEDLQSYLICMTMSYLVGLDCQERYMPHRVAMQFGMDQDLPGEFSGSNVGPKDVYFFVSPRSFEPGVSLKYFNWWRNSEFMCGGKLPNALRISLDTFQMPPGEAEMSSKDHHAPSVATRLKNSETVAWSSVKSEAIDIQDDEWEFGKGGDKFDVLFKPVCESGFPTKQAGSLERPPSIKEVKGEGGFCTPAKSFGLGSLECPTLSSVGVRSRTSVTNNFSPTQRFQDSVEADLVAVAGTSKQMAKDSKEIDDSPPSDSRHRAKGLSSRATSDEVHLKETTIKRKLSTSTEESTDCKDTISMINGNSDELQEECVNVKATTMDVDERDFELQKLDLEKRIEKLEKLMGINPDRG